MENASIDNFTTAEPEIANPSIYPHGPRVVFASVFAVVGVLGIVGNSLVILSVILSKKLRTVTNAFVVNLSAADLWTSLSYPWQSLALVSDITWPLATQVPCYIAAVQLFTGLGASLYSLAVIAFNRFMLVTQTTATYRRWYSPGKVIAMIALTWILPFFVFLFPPFIGVGGLGWDPTDNTCADQDAHARGPEFNLIQSLGLFPLPMTIIGISYLGLYIHLKRHFRKQKRRRAKYGTGAPDGGGTSVGESSVSFSVDSSAKSVDDVAKSNRRAISRQQLAITKNLFMVFCMFFALMSPYFISLAIPSSRKFALYGLTISILNSCVNPIIYTINHPHFKGVLRSILRCRYSDIPEPADWLKSCLHPRK